MDKTKSSEWYRIKNLSGGGADVFIYDEIGCDGIGATAFVKELGKIPGPINLHLNSPGGEVYDGVAIYTALKERADVTVYVDSLAASISSVIAMAGDRVVMAKHSTLMIHDAFGGLSGNAAEMRKMAERLEATSQEIASVYAERAGGTTDDWRAKMIEETWYNAEQAVEAGLADEVAVPRASKVKDLVEPRIFNLSQFKHVPEWVETHDAGRVMSKSNLNQLHDGMSALQKVHAAVCDMEGDCPTSNSLKGPKMSLKNHGDGYGVEDTATTTITACMGASLHETLTDMAQDWLEDGNITMDEFLPLSTLITSLIAAMDKGLDGIGISDREIPADDDDDDDDGPYAYHTITESYAKDDKKVEAKVEEPVEDKVVVIMDGFTPHAEELEHVHQHGDIVHAHAHVHVEDSIHDHEHSTEEEIVDEVVVEDKVEDQVVEEPITNKVTVDFKKLLDQALADAANEE